MENAYINIFTDASGIGMGSYHLNSGLTWNFVFPPDIQSFATMNHLELFTFIVQLLILEHYDALDGKNMLMWMDNQTTVTWFRKYPRSNMFVDSLCAILGSLLLNVNFSI